MLFLDFETKSECDLKKHGTQIYASHPSTEPLCCAFKLDGSPAIWHPGEKLPPFVRRYITQTDGLVAAFNAQFDRLIWENEFTDLPIPLERWYCVAAQCRVNAMPGNLADASRALTGKAMKDIRGAQLIRMMSIPPFQWTPELQREMDDYCIQDVNATHYVFQHTRRLSPREHEDWLVNERINDRGVEVDTELAELATRYATAEAFAIGQRLEALTKGRITKHTQTQRVKDYLLEKAPNLRKFMEVEKQGEIKLSLDKNIRARIATGLADHVVDIDDPSVAEVIQLVDDGNLSSVAKFQKMLDMADGHDDCIRGAFVYAGAGQTQRFASRGLQLHNFKRDCFTPDDTESLVEKMRHGYTLANPMKTLSKLLRPAITGDLIIGDWSQIEARVLPWLANAPDAEDRLDVFYRCDRDPKADDVYTLTSNALRLNSRQAGKVVELACGFGGGRGAMSVMARAYGLSMKDYEMDRAIMTWRGVNEWAPIFWRELEVAALNAMSNPGQAYAAGMVAYCFYPELIGGTLVCTLPGGSMIQYPRAKLERDSYGEVITALKANWKPKQGEKEWPRVKLWHGLLAENVTQATAAAILREALRECGEYNLPVVAHVHDEIIVDLASEPRRRSAPHAAARLQQIMEEPCEWVEGLPLKAVPIIAQRYGK